MSNEAKQQVELILKNCEVTFSAICRGTTKHDDWECDAWSIAFTKRDGRAVHEEFEYFTGTGHRVLAPHLKQSLKGLNPRCLAYADIMKRAKPVAPHAADVLYSLIRESSAAEQTFASWCDDLGMDSDSRKALATYEACQSNVDKLRKLFDSAAREALQNALQDY